MPTPHPTSYVVYWFINFWFCSFLFYTNCAYFCKELYSTCTTSLRKKYSNEMSVTQIAKFKGTTWGHLGPVGPRWPHVGPMNLALRGVTSKQQPMPGAISRPNKTPEAISTQDTVLLVSEIPLLRYDHLIFTIEISIRVRWHLYIETSAIFR